MKQEKNFLWLCIGFLSVVIVAPIMINELYKTNDGYLTLWNASEMLSYIAAIISSAATIYISWIAITQNKKANEINDRLLKIEEINSVPRLCILEEKTMFEEFNENTVWLKIFVKNISNGIIDINKVSELSIHINLLLFCKLTFS